MKWILRLYPLDWRERYEDEMLGILEQHRSTWRTGVDLFHGAWNAHLDYPIRRETMDSTSPRSRPTTVAGGTLLGIAGVFGLMVYEILSNPESVHGAGLTSAIVVAAGLLAYAGAIVWSMRSKEAAVHTALAHGAKFGVVLAACAWVNMALEHFSDLGTTGSIVRGVGMWALTFVIFGAAASASFLRSGSMRLAVLSSVWSALISTIAMLLFGFALGILFMPYMQQILAGAYAQSGMSDPRAFVIRNTLDSASTHLLLAPLLACFFGMIGGYACSRLQTLHRNTTLLIGGLEIALLLTAIAALHMVSVLARPERPPYVMLGLVSLGISMACAHPVFAAFRRSATAT